MAWRISENVIRGEIDCRTKGVVTGTIWLRGHGEPLRLSLVGNPLGDLAGCLMTFTNPKPLANEAVNLSKLATMQTGTVGDLTASKKISTFDLPLKKIIELATAGKPIPTRQANALYLEWFSQGNGRVLIEGADFEVTMSVPPLWRLSPAEESAQIDANIDAFRDFLEGNDLSWTGPDEDDDVSGPDGMFDEFAWEKMLRESDQKSDKLGEVMQKYEGHPDSERLIARAMNWTWVEDELDAEERGLYQVLDDDDDLEAEEAEADFEELKPNPLTEGKDWVRDERGEIQHPLSLRSFKLGMRMWRYADEFNLLLNEKDRTVNDMVSNAQLCAAKLAGSLNDLAYDFDPEPGLVVASLKRAINHLHLSLRASEMVKKGDKIPTEQVEQWRRELFEIREDILRLMHEHRQKLN